MPASPHAPQAHPPQSPHPAAPLPAPAPQAPGSARTSKNISSPRLIGGAILQLAAIGAIGPAIFTVLFTFLGLGLGLLPVFGIGLVFLAALAYMLFATSWLEAARVDGLYGFGLPQRRLRTSGRPGFGGFLRTIWQQSIDPPVWRGIASAAVSTLLGTIVLGFVSVFASGVAGAFAPLFASDEGVRFVRFDVGIPVAWAVPIGILLALLSVAAIIGLALLHGVLTRAILVPSRESLLADQARTSNQQRAGAVRAADVERTRIERDLHDGVQPRLVSVGMTLGMAQQKIDDDPEAAKALIAEAHTSTKAAITELRQLARGIHTSVLDDRGLDAALSALAARSPVPASLDVRLTQRCSQAAETAAYFVIAESLTNAAKHARATDVRIVVRQRDGGLLWARIEDNGIGGAVVVPGGGLDGLTNRVLGVGGQFRLDSPIGGPTSVEVSIPCAF